MPKNNNSFIASCHNSPGVWNSTEGMNCIPLNDIPSFCVWMMTVESIAPKAAIGVYLLTVKAKAYDSQLCMFHSCAHFL